MVMTFYQECTILLFGFRAYGGGIAAAMLVGVLKEIIDPKFDWKDVEYDALGAVTVPLLVISW